MQIPAGTTLNLNGLHFYAHSASVQGTVIGGTITVVMLRMSLCPARKVYYRNAPLSVAGISVSDPLSGLDNQVFLFTLAVPHGSLALLTGVAGGVTAGQISGNGTGNVSVSAMQAEFNATLAADGGLVYQSIGSFVGTDTLTVTANDQNNPTPEFGTGLANINGQARLSMPSPGPAPAMEPTGTTRTTGAAVRSPARARM